MAPFVISAAAFSRATDDPFRDVLPLFGFISNPSSCVRIEASAGSQFLPDFKHVYVHPTDDNTTITQMTLSVTTGVGQSIVMGVYVKAGGLKTLGSFVILKVRACCARCAQKSAARRTKKRHAMHWQARTDDQARRLLLRARSRRARLTTHARARAHRMLQRAMSTFRSCPRRWQRRCCRTLARASR